VQNAYRYILAKRAAAAQFEANKASVGNNAKLTAALK
jgi:hypothetical protein